MPTDGGAREPREREGAVMPQRSINRSMAVRRGSEGDQCVSGHAPARVASRKPPRQEPGERPRSLTALSLDAELEPLNRLKLPGASAAPRCTRWGRKNSTLLLQKGPSGAEAYHRRLRPRIATTSAFCGRFAFLLQEVAPAGQASTWPSASSRARRPS